MIVLVLGNHCTATNEVAKALKDVGAYTGYHTDGYREYCEIPEAHALHKQYIGEAWKAPKPGLFPTDAYRDLLETLEAEHDRVVLSDPRLSFCIDEVLSIGKSLRTKTRIVVVDVDPHTAAERILARDKAVESGRMTPQEALRVAQTYDAPLRAWMSDTNRNYLRLEEPIAAMDDLYDYCEVKDAAE